MNGQRDIVSLSLPLTGGVILGWLLTAFRPLRNSPSGLYVLAALTAAGLFAMLWLVPARRVRQFALRFARLQNPGRKQRKSCVHAWRLYHSRQRIPERWCWR